MTEKQNESPSFVNKLWSRLSFRGKGEGSVNKRQDAALELSAVERQTENSRKGGTIWEAVRKADEPAFQRLVNENRSNVDARGPVGECPVHMLFLYGTETHLNMARYMITHFPHTITQIYNQAVN
jgi:hypothetical protein